MVPRHGKSPAQIGYSSLLPRSRYVSCETWMRLGEASGRENAHSLSLALQALPGRSCPAHCSIADLVDSV